jgi:mannose-6-phosphate isomerase-like protein (cupin superfamily)
VSSIENISAYIESGIIQSYVMGLSTEPETTEVEQMAATHPQIREAIDEFSMELESFALTNAVVPDPTIKPFLLATIDYMKRLEHGELPGAPAELQQESTLSDYAEWLNRPDMILPPSFTDFHAKIIAHTPAALTAIVWIKDMAPTEVHDHEYEKFLVVEGTCTITIENEAHKLVPGDYLAIPLYKNHTVTVTSDIPCKVILQRIAA